MKEYVKDYLESRLGLYRLLAILGATLFFAHELNIAFFVRVFEFIGLENELSVTLASFIPFILSIPLLTKRYKNLKLFYILYTLSAIFFAISILRNLDFLNVYFRPRFGIHKVFLPSGGIFSIYYINLLYDKDNYKDLAFMLLLSTLAMYLISMLQFVMANLRGFWLTEDSTGDMIKINYSLIFGFNMGFAVNSLLGFWFYRKRFIYLLLAMVGYYTILTDGNRMGMVLAFAFWLVIILHNLVNYFKYKEGLKPTVKSLFGFVLFIGIIIGAMFLQNNHIDPVQKLISLVTTERFQNEINKEDESSIVEKEFLDFDEDLQKINVKSIVREDGKLWLYIEGRRRAMGLIEVEGQLYYVRGDGSLVTDQEYWITDTNGILPQGDYYFDSNGVLDINSIADDEKSLNDFASRNPNASRNLALIGAGGLLFDNSRSAIYNLAIEGIKEHPILGVGAYGDRVYTSHRFIWGHSHNILIELAINFGLIITPLIVILLANTFFVMLAKKRSLLTIFYFVFVGTAALLLTSNSFWLEPFIWGLLAFAFLEMNKEDFWYYKLYKKFSR